MDGLADVEYEYSTVDWHQFHLDYLFACTGLEYCVLQGIEHVCKRDGDGEEV